MSALLNLASVLRDVAAERSSAVRALEELRQERDALDSAPLPKADLIRRLDAVVDANLAVFDRNLSDALQRIAHKPSLDLTSVQFPLLTAMNGGGGVDERLVVAIVAASLRDRIRLVIEAMEWPNAGLPAKERPAHKARLDAQIEALQRQLEVIDESLSNVKGDL